MPTTREIARNIPFLEELIGVPFAQWHHQCHRISLALVKTGVFGLARVARGVCEGVGSQHSWIVLGDDCYDRDAEIVDPTLWSYDPTVKGIWTGKNLRRHTPHGYGSIWKWGKPAAGPGPVIELTPTVPLSSSARQFLEMLGPLDLRGWGMLAHAPVNGWPSSAIIAAMYDTKALRHLIPIDIIGMNTSINPDGLYW